MSLRHALPRRFFFMPIPPTPNGRLHLGHIAGPYLRMDIAARFLRGHGHDVGVVSSVDGFDTYVLWKASQEGRTPFEVCDTYRGGIIGDLASMDIDVQEVTDVVGGSAASIHADGARRAVRRLVELGLTERVQERVLYSRSTGRYIVGAWLLGRCPHCGAQAAGFFCEACGNFFRPGAMVDPSPRLGDGDLEWRDVESLFLRVQDHDALIEGVRDAGAPEGLISIVRRFLRDDGGLFRLTAPGTWGVEWTPDASGNPSVLFEAGWEYALSCGSRYMSTRGLDSHPMSLEGATESAVSFGIDNAILLLVGSMSVLRALGDTKPFDFTFTNYFLNLEGEKFSTSRLHVIWVEEIIHRTPVRSDPLRFFLSVNSPERDAADFSIADFLAFNNEFLSGVLNANVGRAHQALAKGAPMPMSDGSTRHIEGFFAGQEESLRLDKLCVGRAAEMLVEYCRADGLDLAHPASAYWWMKGLALLSAPIMPRFGLAVWAMLGGRGQPSHRGFRDATEPAAGAATPFFERLTIDDLRPCLPARLTSGGA